MDSDEEWDIILSYIDRKKNKFFTFPKSATIAAVKAAWADEFGVNGDTIELVSQTSLSLDEETTMEQHGETFPGSKLVKLRVEQKSSFECEVFEGSGARCRLQIGLTSLPEALHPMMRQAFGIDEGVLFRLRTDKRLLCYNRTLREQNVTPDETLQIDLAFEGVIQDLWDDSSSSHLVYSSEAADQLRSGGEAAENQKLKCKKAIVDTDRRIVDAILPVLGDDAHKFKFTREVRRDIVLMIGKVLRDEYVWPTDKMGYVQRRNAGLQSPVFDGKPVPKSTDLCEVDLPSNGLFITDPLRLIIRKGKKRKIVHVPQSATVYDVREFVKGLEKTDGFRLKKGGTFLDEEHTKLCDAGICDGDELVVVPEAMIVRVQLGEQLLMLNSERRSMTFSPLAKLISQATDRHVEEVKEKTFYCVGCSRRLRLCDEEYQELPAACCRVRSLYLEEQVGEDPSGVFANIGARKEERQSFSQQHSCDEDKGGAVNRPERHSFSQQYVGADLSMPTRRRQLFANIGARKKERQSFSQQHSCDAIFQDLFIYNYTSYDDHHHQRYTMVVTYPVTVCKVREILSKEMQTDLQTLKLRRKMMGFRSTSCAVRVCDDKDEPGSNPLLYAFPNGELAKPDNVKNVDLKDDDEFILVPSKRCVIVALEKK